MEQGLDDVVAGHAARDPAPDAARLAEPHARLLPDGARRVLPHAPAAEGRPRGAEAQRRGRVPQVEE